MKVEVWQVGGFAGIERRLGAAESARLASGEAARLGALVERLAAWCRDHPEAPGADRLRYRVQVSGPGVASRTYEVPDEGDPADPGVALAGAIAMLVQGG